MFYFLLIVLFLPIRLFAAQVFSWDNCIEMVSKKNAELESAQSSLKSSENLQGAARYNFFPQLSADLANDRGENIGLLRVTPSVDTMTHTQTNNYVALLTARLNIFNGLGDLGEVRRAEANTNNSIQNLLITKAKLSLDLKNAFEGLRFAKEYQKLTKEFIKRRRENLNIVELRAHNGMENKGSVLLSQADLDRAKYDDLTAINAEKVARTRMARVLGIDEFKNIDIRGDVPMANPPKNPDLRDLALTSPFYQGATYKESSAEAGITVAKSEFFPRFNIMGTVGKQGTTFWPDDIDRWAIGITLTFPFFNGGKDYYGTKSAINSWAASVSNRIDVSRDVLQKLETAYTQYVEAVVKYQVDLSYMNAAKLRAEIARKKYNNGLLIFDDWIIIENNYVDYSRNYIISKRDRVLAEANWEYAQGTGVIP